MKVRIPVIAALLLCAACYREAPIVPTDAVDEPLFAFPQGNESYDRTLQTIQEDYGTYVIYKDIPNYLLNRAWVNVYLNSYIVADPVPDALVPWYIDFIKENVFDYVDPAAFGKFLPKYVFLVSNMHMILDGESKPHIPAKVDGIDFWAVSFQTTAAGALDRPDVHKTRSLMMYKLLQNMVDAGAVEIPASFKEGIDYETQVYDDINNPTLTSPYHYKSRGFVRYVDPSFDYHSPLTATFFSIAQTYNGDFLMFLREILYYTTAEFIADYGSYPLVMRRYNIVLDVFKQMGIDLKAITDGTKL